jgi:hypothetical protein
MFALCEVFNLGITSQTVVVCTMLGLLTFVAAYRLSELNITIFFS